MHGYGSNDEWSLGSIIHSLDCNDLRSVPALEAPLTVCEDIGTLDAVLSFIAARKGHARRQTTILLVWTFCLAAVATMGWAVSGTEYRQTTLNRPFFFSAAPLGSRHIRLAYLMLLYLQT